MIFFGVKPLCGVSSSGTSRAVPRVPTAGEFSVSRSIKALQFHPFPSIFSSFTPRTSFSCQVQHRCHVAALPAGNPHGAARGGSQPLPAHRGQPAHRNHRGPGLLLQHRGLAAGKSPARLLGELLLPPRHQFGVISGCFKSWRGKKCIKTAFIGLALSRTKS